MIGHSMGSWFGQVRWLVFCRRCGLVALKNEATQKALRARCSADES